MARNLYLTLQFGSYEGNADVLNLMEFPSEGLLPARYAISVERWGEGRRYRNRLDNIKEMTALLKKVQKRKLNIIGCKFTFEPFLLRDYEIRITAINSTLYLSPYNSLWGNVYGYLLDRQADENMRASCEGREMSLRLQEIKRYPSLLVTEICFDSGVETSELIMAWCCLLDKVMPYSVISIGPFGCADLSSRPQVIDLLSDLATHPKTYEYLDERFDEVHDIMLGKKELCKKLFDAVSEKASYREVHAGGEAGLGLVCMPDKRAVDSALIENYFVKKDKSTARHEIGPDMGEYTIGNRRFFSKKRYQERLENKTIHSIFLIKKKIYPEESIIFFPLVLEKYHPKLELTSDDVLLTGGQITTIEKFEREVARNYETLSNIREERERIWLAHESAYGLFHYSKEQIDFIRKMHFDKKRQGSGLRNQQK